MADTTLNPEDLLKLDSVQEGNPFFVQTFKKATKGNFYGVCFYDPRMYESIIIVYFKNGAKLTQFNLKYYSHE